MVAAAAAAVALGPSNLFRRRYSFTAQQQQLQQEQPQNDADSKTGLAFEDIYIDSSCLTSMSTPDAQQLAQVTLSCKLLCLHMLFIRPGNGYCSSSRGSSSSGGAALHRTSPVHQFQGESNTSLTSSGVHLTAGRCLAVVPGLHELFDLVCDFGFLLREGVVVPFFCLHDTLLLAGPAPNSRVPPWPPGLRVETGEHWQQPGVEFGPAATLLRNTVAQRLPQ